MKSDGTPDPPTDNDLVFFVDGEEIRIPGPGPELQAMFDKTDALLAGLSGAEARAAAASIYFDANGEPQLRRRRIRAVPDLTDEAR